MVFITLMVINTHRRIDMLVWVIALSLGFYGVKGGIFTMTSGGGHHVRGPNGTFIGGNNEIGLALIMTIPLIRYLYLCQKRWWVKRGLGAAIILTLIAILGTQSRGAFLGLGAMLFFMIIKSRKRTMFLVVMALAIPLALSVMPQSWYDRMDSIRNYEQDASAQGRIRAWTFAIDTAVRRPLGGGYEVFAGRTDAHSIYFEILGEHGFGGLFLFLLLGLFTWRSASWTIRKVRDFPELAWCGDLSRMMQVSLVGYASAGAFLGLAYFDLVYHLVAIVVVTKVLVQKSVAEERQSKVEAGIVVRPTEGAASIR
jgi:probable O-glycosylation ligase (exosortase A-associated)